MRLVGVANKSKGGGTMAGGANTCRKRPYGMMLLLALMAALLSVVMLHKIREKRVFGLLLHDRDNQLFTLQLMLEKEREHSKELKRKHDDMKAKIFALRSQKMDLTHKLMEAEGTAAYLKEKQRELESALQEKQNQVKGLTDKEAESIKTNLRVSALTELLKQKEAELEEMKQHLTNQTLQENTATDKNNGEDNAASQIGKLEGRTIEETQVDNSTEMAGDKKLRNSRGGDWVKFETNVDDERLKDEESMSAVSKDEDSSQNETLNSENQETRVGRASRRRTRKRRHRVAQKGESVKQNNELLERRDQTADNSIVEGNKEVQATDIASDSEEQVVLKGTTINSQDGENSKVNLENAEHSHVDDGKRSESDQSGATKDKEERADEGQIIKPTDEQSEMPEKSQDDESKNKSDEHKGDATVSTRDGDDSVERQKQEVLKETSNPEQNEAHSVTGGHQNQLAREETKKADDSSVRGADDDDRELAESINSDRVAEI